MAEQIDYDVDEFIVQVITYQQKEEAMKAKQEKDED